MKVQTKDLADLALDWAVAKSKGYADFVLDAKRFREMHDTGHYNYSTDWSQGGSIIDREIGNLWKHNKLQPSDPDVWTAAAYQKAQDGTLLYYEEGPTPLIAAMRCYVASKIGESVDVPEELL